jgi:hypothetical protein
MPALPLDYGLASLASRHETMAKGHFRDQVPEDFNSVLLADHFYHLHGFHALVKQASKLERVTWQVTDGGSQQ